MTHQEFDLLCMGASGGVLAGAWLGYRLRRALERSPSRVEAVERPRANRAQAKPALVPLGVALADVETAKIRKSKPKLIVMDDAALASNGAGKSAVFERETWVDEREIVLAALVDAGYKKSVAVVAADACDERERVSVEAWVVAALGRARGGR